MTEDLVRALAGLQEEEALNIVEEKLRSGADPTDILEEARQAMEVVGKRFSTGEYFMPELVYSGEILKRITEVVKPKLKGAFEVERIGKCIIGTVAGDIHDIGKDMVVFMLDVNGFEVCDLGIDVPAQKFVDAIKETDTKVVGLSGFLTLAFDSMKETIDSIRAAGLRDSVKIMIGGGQIDEVVQEYTGADAYGRDAMAAVSLARKWLEEGGQ
jgi:5-methyltetrahydrofolate--homocysteine methyltransferase